LKKIIKTHVHDVEARGQDHKGHSDTAMVAARHNSTEETQNDNAK
jgi:hypothetical protein